MNFCRASVLLLTVAAVVQAGVITSSSGLEGPATISFLDIVTGDANNESVGFGGANRVQVQKSMSGVGTVDMQFTVENSGGTTEYYFDHLVTNFSGVAWSQYKFELGFGLGTDFVRSSVFDFLDFDTPDRDPMPISTAFSFLVHGSNEIDFSTGTVGKLSAANFRLFLDVPDGTDIPQDYWTADGYTFTIRQTLADVPEPSTWALLTIGFAGLLAYRRK